MHPGLCHVTVEDLPVHNNSVWAHTLPLLSRLGRPPEAREYVNASQQKRREEVTDAKGAGVRRTARCAAVAGTIAFCPRPLRE